MNILQELWYGNICPGEQPECWTVERKKLLKLYTRNVEILSATLNDVEKQTLEKIHDCHMEMEQYAQCNAIISGFRLAVQMMAASMAGFGT